MRTIRETTLHVRYLWRGTGFLSTLRTTARKLLSPVLEIDTAVIAVRYRGLKPAREEDFLALKEQGITAALVDSSEALENFSGGDPDKTILPKLRHFLEQRPNRIALLALIPQPGDSPDEIAGYNAFDRGEFTYWNGRLRGVLPSDCMYISDIYMSPAHRGARIHLAFRKFLSAYCPEQEIRKTMGFVKSHNAPSIAAHKVLTEDSRGTINGTVRRITIFSGLFEFVTPPETVIAAMNAPMPDA